MTITATPRFHQQVATAPGFSTKKDVVVKAYADAVELANQASVILETSSA